MNASTFVGKAIRQNLLFRLYRFYILDSLLIIKRLGFRELIRQRGRRFLLIIIGYYLVRDSLLYIVIPFFAARGLL